MSPDRFLRMEDDSFYRITDQYVIGIGINATDASLPLPPAVVDTAPAHAPSVTTVGGSGASSGCSVPARGMGLLFIVNSSNFMASFVQHPRLWPEQLLVLSWWIRGYQLPPQRAVLVLLGIALHISFREPLCTRSGQHPGACPAPARCHVGSDEGSEDGGGGGRL